MLTTYTTKKRAFHGQQKEQENGIHMLFKVAS